MRPYEIDNVGVCSQCTKKIGDEKIKCTHCDAYFHATCNSADPICRTTFLKTFHGNTIKRNFTWSCDDCLTFTEQNKVATLSQQIAGLNQTVQKLVASHSKDGIKTLMDREFTQLTEFVNTEIRNRITEVATTLSKQFVALKSELTNNLPVPIQPPNVSGTVWDDSDRLKKVKSTMLIKPDAEGKKVNPKEVRKIVTREGIPVDSLVEVQNGNVYVNCPDKQSRDRVSDLLGESHAGNPVEKLQAKLPTVSILRVTADDMKKDDDSEFTKSELESDIYKQNKLVAQLIDNGSVLKVVYIKSPSRDQVFYTVAARVSPDIRILLHKLKNKIHMGLRVHSIVDRFHVLRCNNCMGLGHYADKCEHNTVCGYCTENHKSDDCPDKRKPHTEHKCVNCRLSEFDPNGHPAFWSKCRAYKENQEKLKRTIGFDYTSLN